jgi:hypothetical protein
MRSPDPARAGITVAFVLNPMFKAMASSFPTNDDTMRSTSRCRIVVPYSRRGEPTDDGRHTRLPRTSRRQVTSQSSAKPR